MLFDIDKEGNLFSQDPRITLVPELNTLYKHKSYGAKYIRWVALVYDYDSPYRMKPFPQRVEDVTKQIFGLKTHKPLEDKAVKDAVKVYNELQYDPLQEQYKLAMDAVEDFNALIRKTKVAELEDWDEVKKYQVVLIDLVKVQDMALGLRKKLGEEAAAKKSRLRGGGQKSFIEDRLVAIHKELDNE